MLAVIVLLTLRTVQVSACDNTPVYDMRVSLKARRNTLLVMVENSPNEPILIATPIAEWRPGVGGVEFKVWTLAGSEITECAMIDYAAGSQKQSQLRPSDRLVQIFDLSTIKRNFCLGNGDFLVQAVLHNELDGKAIAKDVFSNPVHVRIGE